MAGVACLLASGSNGRGRAAWAWLGVAMLALSADETLSIHESLERSLGFRLSVLALQPLVGLAVIAIFVLLIRRSPPWQRFLLTAAIAALVIAQATSALSGELTLSHAAIVALSVGEETLEMLVDTLVLAAASVPAVRAAAEYSSGRYHLGGRAGS